ncbi:MAG: protein-export chaperone SecB [Alphaproteobacteria bacterium]|nr:protein-export chaperone SecB [Alphaproteobacteria bacterium]
MSDQSAGATPDGAGQPRPTQQPPLTVNAQYVKDFSFENPNAPNSLTLRQAPQIAVNVDVKARPIAESAYEVLLVIGAEAKHESQVAFVVELTYGGVFTLSGIPEEHIRPILLIECPRLLFPFARAILSEATRDGGFPPLSLQPIDFAQLYRQQLQQQAPPLQPSTGSPPTS